MRTFYSFLIATFLTANFLTASENITSEPNADRSKRRAVTTRSISRSAAPSSPLAPISGVSTNSTNNFAEADNSRYRQPASLAMLEDQPFEAAVQMAAVLTLVAPQEHPHTAHNSDWKKTQLPKIHRLLKDIIIDLLLSDDPEVSVDDRFQQIRGAHNLFLTCKHWAEFTIDRQSDKDATNKVSPRWIPLWKPLTLFNDDINRVNKIRTAMYPLLAEITGFDPETAIDKTARQTTASDLYASYSDEQIGRMLANFKVQKNNGIRAYYLRDYHNSLRPLGNNYWIEVRKVQQNTKTLNLSNLVMKGRKLKFVPHNLGILGEKLRILDLSDNCLTELPKSMAQLSVLERLDLSQNRSLSHLPSSLRRMTSLRHLCLSTTGNWVEIELPPLLQSLVMDDVDFSNLVKITGDGLNFLEVSQVKMPHTLSRRTAYRNMNMFLRALSRLTRLQTLVLKDVTPQELTPDLAMCTNLQSLRLELDWQYNGGLPFNLKTNNLPQNLVNLSLQGNLNIDHIAENRGLGNLQVLDLIPQVLDLITPTLIPLNPHITNFKNLRLLTLESQIFAPSIFEPLSNLELLIFKGDSITLAQQGLESFPLFLRHYTEFVYTDNRPTIYNPIGLSIISRKKFPWNDDSSRILFSQIDLYSSFYPEDERVQVKERRSDQRWSERYVPMGMAPKKFFDNWGSAFKAESLY